MAESLDDSVRDLEKRIDVLEKRICEHEKLINEVSFTTQTAKLLEAFAPSRYSTQHPVHTVCHVCERTSAELGTVTCNNPNCPYSPAIYSKSYDEPSL